MPSISFQQAYALSSGCFISPVGNTKFKLTNETGQNVDLKTIVSGNLINLSTVPSLQKDGILNPPNQSYNLADSNDLSSVFTTFGTLGLSILIQNQPRLKFLNGISNYPEDFKDGTASYLLSSSGSAINAILPGTTGIIQSESYAITSIKEMVTALGIAGDGVFAIPRSIQITFNSNPIGFCGNVSGGGVINFSPAAPLGDRNFFTGITGWRIKITGITTEPNLNGTLNIFPYYNEIVDNINDLINIPVYNPNRVYKRGEFVSFPITPSPTPGQPYFTNICYSLTDSNTDNPGPAPDLNNPGSKWHSLLASGVVNEFVEDPAYKVGVLCFKKNAGASVTLTIPFNAFREFKIGNNGLESAEPNPWYVPSWNQIENSDLITGEGTITFEPIYINKQGIPITDLPDLCIVNMNNNAQQNAITNINLQVLEVAGGLIYKEGGSFDSNASVSDTEKLYHFTGQKILKKIK